MAGLADQLALLQKYGPELMRLQRIVAPHQRQLQLARQALERLAQQVPAPSEPPPFVTSPGQISRRVVYVRVMVCRAGTRRHVTYNRGRRGHRAG
jgi:hypothetical protein